MNNNKSQEYTPVFNEAKTTEAASVLLRLEGGEMNYMKLVKLLYFVDKTALKEWERPITFDRYFSMKDGQVLTTVLDLVRQKIKGRIWNKHIKNSGQYTVKITSNKIELNLLSPAELNLIKSVYADLGKYSQFDLGRLTKQGSEYKKTDSSIETSLNELLSDLKFGEEEINGILENLKERAEIDSLFGA